MGQWTVWMIPLNDFSAAGVNVAAVKKMIIGLGDRDAPTPGGAGVIYVDDIAVKRGPVGHWALDDGEGTVASDSTGNGNGGTLSDGLLWVAGKIGGALEFDGASTFVEVPFSDSLDLLNKSDFTVAAWFKADEIPPENKEVLQQADGTGTGRTWLFVHNANDIRSFLGGTTTSSGIGVEAETWVHAAAVVTEAGDADTIQLYVNGQAAGAPVTGGMEDCDGAYIIGRHKNPTNYWDGLIDDVRLYNRALSEAELAELAGM